MRESKSVEFSTDDTLRSALGDVRAPLRGYLREHSIGTANHMVLMWFARLGVA
ncbi:hypothetical protein BH18ACI4_BH18ACI4_12550 [soil metagenome]